MTILATLFLPLTLFAREPAACSLDYIAVFYGSGSIRYMIKANAVVSLISEATDRKGHKFNRMLKRIRRHGCPNLTADELAKCIDRGNSTREFCKDDEYTPPLQVDVDLDTIYWMSDIRKYCEAACKATSSNQ